MVGLTKVGLKWQKLRIWNNGTGQRANNSIPTRGPWHGSGLPYLMPRRAGHITTSHWQQARTHLEPPSCWLALRWPHCSHLPGSSNPWLHTLVSTGCSPPCFPSPFNSLSHHLKFSCTWPLDLNSTHHSKVKTFFWPLWWVSAQARGWEHGFRAPVLGHSSFSLRLLIAALLNFMPHPSWLLPTLQLTIRSKQCFLSWGSFFCFQSDSFMTSFWAKIDGNREGARTGYRVVLRVRMETPGKENDEEEYGKWKQMQKTEIGYKTTPKLMKRSQAK